MWVTGLWVHVLSFWGKALVLVWNSNFSFIINTLTNDSLCISDNRILKCSKGSTSPMNLASTVPGWGGELGEGELYDQPLPPTFRCQARAHLVPGRGADMLSPRCYQNNMASWFHISKIHRGYSFSRMSFPLLSKVLLLLLFSLKTFWYGPRLKSSFLWFLAVRHVGSELPNQGSALHPLHWKEKPSPLGLQASPP